jgi:hypothetical protein
MSNPIPPVERLSDAELSELVSSVIPAAVISRRAGARRRPASAATTIMSEFIARRLAEVEAERDALAERVRVLEASLQIWPATGRIALAAQCGSGLPPPSPPRLADDRLPRHRAGRYITALAERLSSYVGLATRHGTGAASLAARHSRRPPRRSRAEPTAGVGRQFRQTSSSVMRPPGPIRRQERRGYAVNRAFVDGPNRPPPPPEPAATPSEGVLSQSARERRLETALSDLANAVGAASRRGLVWVSRRRSGRDPRERCSTEAAWELLEAGRGEMTEAGLSTARLRTRADLNPRSAGATDALP